MTTLELREHSEALAGQSWESDLERLAEQLELPPPEPEPAALPEPCEQRPEQRPPAQRQPSVMPDGFLRAHEAAELLSVSTGTISRWRKAGRFGQQAGGCGHPADRPGTGPGGGAVTTLHGMPALHG